MTAKRDLAAIGCPFAGDATRDWWLWPDGVFDGSALRNDQCLLMSGGRIAEFVPRATVTAGERVWKTPLTATPGFFDLQVNGGGGFLLNNDPTPEGVLGVARAHAATGTVSLLPTVISDRPEITRSAALAVLECRDKEGVRGIHIEGPHISVLKRGTHRAELIRPFDAETLDLVTLLRERGLPVLLTLAPECVPAGTVARLTNMGVVVSAGHSAASADAVEAALAEGLRMFTHLFNGMSQMTQREPGVVGAALNSEAWCGIIADGHHVDRRVLHLAFRARPRRDRMVVVSDAMPTWNGPDEFVLYGATLSVRDGRLINQEGSLAGAHIDMASSVEYLARIGIPCEDALRAASCVPAAAIGLPELAPALAEGTDQNAIAFVDLCDGNAPSGP